MHLMNLVIAKTHIASAILARLRYLLFTPLLFTCIYTGTCAKHAYPDVASSSLYTNSHPYPSQIVEQELFVILSCKQSSVNVHVLCAYLPTLMRLNAVVFICMHTCTMHTYSGCARARASSATFDVATRSCTRLRVKENDNEFVCASSACCVFLRSCPTISAPRQHHCHLLSLVAPLFLVLYTPHTHFRFSACWRVHARGVLGVQGGRRCQATQHQ